MRNYILFGLLILVFGSKSLALDEESVNLEALTKTQNLLKDAEQRNGVVKESDGAKKADDVVGTVSMGDADAKNSIYGIAADVMPWLVSQTNGDPVKMFELLEKAKNDPKAFLSSLPEAERRKIRNLGNYLDSKRSPASASPSP